LQIAFSCLLADCVAKPIKRQTKAKKRQTETKPKTGARRTTKENHYKNSIMIDTPEYNAYQMDPKDLAFLRELPGNKSCVDCGCDNTEWASVTLGTFFCLECSGKHR
jgi:hypothetical protein